MCAVVAGLALTVPGAAAGAAVSGAPARAAYTSVPGRLYSVTAVSARDAWAVGTTHVSHYGCGPKCQTLTEHWNSKSWTVIPSPNPPSSYLNALFSASAVSRDNIWAVGTTDYASTLILHWNGRSWS